MQLSPGTETGGAYTNPNPNPNSEGKGEVQRPVSQELGDAQLWGGAASCTLPKAFSDVSDLREVPDNQMVYVHTSADVSLIFELLQMEEEVVDADMGVHYFQDLALANDSANTAVDDTVLLSVLDSPLLNPSTHGESAGSICVGRQQVSKFNSAQADVVMLIVVVFRLKQVATDLVVSISWPVGPAEAFDEVARIGVPLILHARDPLILRATADEEGATHSSAAAAHSGVLPSPTDIAVCAARCVVRSCEIKDWALFG